MKIGDTVIRTPISIADPFREKGEPVHKPMQGTVVYIHPEGRYHTVEFVINGKVIMESFK